MELLKLLCSCNLEVFLDKLQMHCMHKLVWHYDDGEQMQQPLHHLYVSVVCSSYVVSSLFLTPFSCPQWLRGRHRDKIRCRVAAAHILSHVETSWMADVLLHLHGYSTATVLSSRQRKLRKHGELVDLERGAKETNISASGLWIEVAVFLFDF